LVQIFLINQARRRGVGEEATPGHMTFRGPPPSLSNTKIHQNARMMHHFEKKNSINFSPEGPHKHALGAHGNVSLGPAVALDWPGHN